MGAATPQEHHQNAGAHEHAAGRESPLFDVDRFRRHIEAAYVNMWQRHQRGEPASSFAVDGIA